MAFTSIELNKLKNLHKVFAVAEENGFFRDHDEAEERLDHIFHNSVSEHFFTNGSTEFKIFVNHSTNTVTFSNFRGMKTRVMTELEAAAETF